MTDAYTEAAELWELLTDRLDDLPLTPPELIDVMRQLERRINRQTAFYNDQIREFNNDQDTVLT